MNEVSHIARKDHWVAGLQVAVTSVYWWKPLAWIVSRKIALLRELICDDMVLQHEHAPRDYAESIITLAEQQAGLAPLGISLTSVSEVEQRIRRIISHRVSGLETKLGRWAIAGVWLFALASTTGVIIAQVPSASTELKIDHFGDPLPSGATARLGTMRFRQGDEVSRIAYSDDGKMIATTEGTQIILWNAETGERIRKFEGATAFGGQPGGYLSFSPDSQEIAMDGMSGVQLFETATGFELETLTGNAADLQMNPFGGGGACAYSHDGLQVAAAGSFGINVFDTNTTSVVVQGELMGQRSQITDLCWSTDDIYVAAAALEPAIEVWKVRASSQAKDNDERDDSVGKIVRRFDRPDVAERSFTRCVHFAPDGETVWAMVGNRMCIWDFETGEIVSTFETGLKYVNDMVLSPDARRILIGGSQDDNKGLIRTYDVTHIRTPELLREVETELWIMRGLAVDAKFEKVVVGAVYPTIRQWNIQTGEPIASGLTGFGHSATIYTGVFTPEDEYAITSGPNREFLFWKVASGKYVKEWEMERSADTIVFTHDGKYAFTKWSNGGQIDLHEAATGKTIRTFDKGATHVKAFVLSRDGTQLVSVDTASKYTWSSIGGNETIHVWDVESGESVREFGIATASTESAVLVEDRRWLVTGSGNGEIHVTDLTTGKNVALLLGHEHSVECMVLTQDGSTLVTGSLDQTIRVWDTRTWQLSRTMRGHRRALTSMVLHPDGTTLISAGGARQYPTDAVEPPQIRFWNIQNGDQIGYLSGHDQYTHSLAISADGQKLLSTHPDTTAILWDTSGMNPMINVK